MITASMTTITPDMASDLLNKNTGNRPIKKQHLEFICEEIRCGRWQVNGDAIRIAIDGTLIDGQHRLAAVVRTGISITTMIVSGVEKSAFETIDSGASRSNADTLAVLGEKNTRNLAAALLLVKDLLDGNTSFAHVIKTSNTEIIGLIENHPDIRSSVKWGCALVRLSPPSASISLHYLFSRVNKQMADTFFEKLTAGVGLEFDDAVFSLRQRLIENATSKSKLTRRYVMALFIKAWNAHRKGQKLKCLRFREAGDCPEMFPDWR